MSFLNFGERLSVTDHYFPDGEDIIRCGPGHRCQDCKTVRGRAIHALGGKCRRCGFSDTRALQIDHVNRNKRKESSYAAARKVLSGNTTDYQLLCANCNWIKRAENGETRATKASLNWEPPEPDDVPSEPINYWEM